MKKIAPFFLTLLIFSKIQSQCPAAGTISFQRWNNITGGAVTSLTSNANYPNNPSSSGTRTLFEMSQNIGNDLGIKMYGYICPPSTGNYVFWIASNNSGELWLSTSVNAAGKVRIAYNTSSTSSREWNMFTTQKSVSIALTAGQKYYVEALMKESSGNDHLAVGWAKPGQSTTSPSEVIPGTSLSVNSSTDVQAPSAPANLTASSITFNSFTLAWTAATDNVAVTGYDVYRGTVKLNTALITTTSYNVTGLAPNTAYSMTVRARDAATNERASSPLSVTTLPDTQAPTAPTNLRTSNITVNSFTLAWNASTDNVAVTGYDVYRNGVKINTNNITGTSFSVTGLAPNTTYSMTVRARDAASNETASTAFPVTTIPDTQVPSVPSNLRTSNMTMSSFTLAWNASTDNVAVTGYDVYRNGVKINTANITGLTFSVTGLTPSTVYSMTVRAKDAAGNERASNALSVTTSVDTQAPSAPTGLIASSIATTSFALAWTAATDNVAVTGYNVYSGGVKLNTAVITGLIYIVTGLAPNTIYSVTVRARDAAANETASTPLSVTTLPDTENPSAPTGLNASAITTTSFTLSWNASTDNIGVTGYDVYNGTAKLNTATITGLSYNVSGLNASTVYSITVRAKDAAGNEGTSNILSVTTNDNPDTENPSAPTGLNASAITTTSFTLSWNASTDNIGVTGYDVYNGTAKLNTATITGLSYNVSGLNASTVYSITVRAKDAAGNEGTSNILSVTTNDNPDTENPSAPTGLNASAITTTSFTLSWNASTDNIGVTGYDVYNGTAKLNTATITGLSYNVSGLNASTVYSITVRAKDAAGNEGTSNILSVTTNDNPDTENPSAPTGLNASVITTTSFTLSWNAATDNIGVIGYDVYSGAVKLNAANITGLSYNVSGLNASTVYSITVRAKDAAGNEGTSNILSVTTNDNPDTENPSAPTGLNASAITTTSFTLSWNASTDNIGVTGYDVYSGVVKLNAANITSLSYNVSGLNASTVYSITVRAKDAAGNEGTSNILSVTTNDNPDTENPSAPTGLNASAITTTSFTLSWNASTDNISVTGYDVYSGAVKLNAANITSLSYNVSGLNASTVYSITVRAKDAAGNEGISNILSVTTNDNPDTENPSAPTGLNASAITTTSFTLSWNASTDNISVTGYDVYSGAVKLNAANITSLSYNVSGLNASTVYSITVRAKDAAGNEGISNILSVTTNDNPDTENPSAPTGLNASAITTTSFTLSWNASTDNIGVTGYDVYNGTAKLNTATITGLSYNVSGLNASTVYSITVRAKDAAGNEGTSNILSVTTNDNPDTENPSAPTGLNASVITTTSFTLSWNAATDNIGVIGYDVYSGAVKLNAANITGLSYNVSGLNASTVYSITVRAKDAAGNEGISNILSVTTNDNPDTENPSAPTGLNASAITTTSFTLSWNASTDNIGVTGYDVYNGTAKLNTATITGLSYNVSGLNASTVYSITVRAKDAAGNEGTSNILSVTTNDNPDTENPSAPTGLNASVITTTSFTLSWNAATDNIGVIGYDVYSGAVKLNAANITGLSYNVSGLNASTVYSITVRAKDAAGNEGTSNILSVTTNDNPDTENPSAPTGLNASAITTTSFTLSWNASTDNIGVTGYDVYSGVVKLNAANITSLSYNVSGLNASTVYSITVRAKDAAGNEGTSNILSVTTNDNPDTENPSAPTGLNASAITTTSFTLSWNASTDNISVTGYDVYSGAVKLNAANITGLSYNVSGLNASTVYSITVRAKDAAGNEGISNILSVTTNDNPDTENPSAPTGLNASAITTTSFTLSWNASTDNIGVTGYDVYSGAVKLNAANITSLSYNVSGLNASTVYSITVRAKDAAGNEGISNILSVTTNDNPDTENPSAPTGLNASAITTTSFTLSWNASTDNIGVTGYDVYNGTAKLNTATITGLSYNVSGLNASTVYSITVRAKDAAGNEGTSNILSVTTNDNPDTENPSAPTGLNASAITTTSFTLSWNASTDNIGVTGYDVYSGVVKLNAANITGLSYNVSGLNASTVYSITVRAKDAAGNEGISNILSVTTNDNPDTENPSAPTGLNASVITTTSFTLSWNASTDNISVTGYDVYSGAVKLNAANITSLSYNVSGLNASTVYSITVRAKDAAGNEGTSNILSVTTNDNPDTENPSAPTGLNASAITTTSFTLSWNAATDNIGVTGYDVYSGVVKLNAANITSLSYNVSGLNASTVYSITVRAKDAAGNEGTSNILSVTTNDNPDTENPSAPTGLNASAITTTSFTLSWNAATDNIGVTGYDVYSGAVKLNAANITGLSYNVSGLNASTVYSIAVRAKDAAGNEGTSNILSVTTNDNPDTENPSAPTGLNASVITTTSFTLSWNASTDNISVTGYDVYSGAVKLNAANITSLSYNVSGLNASTVYSITVRAKDAAGNEGTSNILSVTTNDNPDTENPSAPTGLNASAITTTSFTLSWNASTDNISVTGYDVYSGAVKLNAANITSLSYNVSGLNASTVYSITVRAKDAAGNEGISNILSVTTNDNPDTENPSAPTGLNASVITTTSFTLSWNASTDNISVTGYDVYSGAVKLNAANITSLSYNVSGLNASTVYSITVRAKDAAGNEGTSNILSVTTNDNPDTENPSAPTGLNASAITTTSFTLSWNASTDNISVTGYDVYSGAVKLNAANITSLSYNVSGLNASTVYSITVRAKDAAGNEGTSNILSVTTNDNPDTENPSAPTGLNASAITTVSFTLSWNASTDNIAVTGYDVYNGTTKLNAANITGLSYNVTGLAPNTAYSMRVRARDAATNEAESNALSVTTNDVPDTENPSAPAGLSASAITISSFTLSWNASTDNIAVTGYDVYSGVTKLNTGNITGLTYNVTNLTPSTVYSMTVRARDAANNESTSSAALAVTTNDDGLAPSAPTNLSASALTSTSFTLSWNASTDNIAVTGYDVYSGVTKLNTGNITGLTYNVTNLTPSTVYSMTVRARDAANNESTSSAALAVTTNDDGLAPSAPTNLSASALTSTSFTLSWNASTDNIAVTGYDVYSGVTKLNTGNITGLTYNVTDLTPSTVYSMTVRARDAANNETASTALSVTTNDDGLAPSAPTSLSASALTSTSFTLSWNASTDNIAVTGYDVYSGVTKLNTGNITGLTYNVTNLTPSTVYSMTVRARDAANNESTSSAALAVTTNDDGLAPSAPTSLSASALTSTSFALSWNASTDNIAVTGYDVYSGVTKLNTGNITGLTYNVTNLTPSTVYSMTVRARDAANNESTSSAALAVTTNDDGLAPSAPTNLSASALTSTSFTLSWNASTDNIAVTGYDVYSGTVKLNTATITALSFSVTGLTQNTVYSMTVRAKDAAGYETPSIPLLVTTSDAQAPTAPTNLIASSITATSFTLAWTAATDNVAVTGYDVYSGTVKVNTATITALSFSVTGLTQNTVYSMTVRAKDAAGYETPSIPLLVTTSDAQAPTAPTNLIASSITATSFTLAWTAATDNVAVTGYDVYSGDVKLNAVNIAGLTYSVTGLAPNTVYSITVRARDAATNQSNSSAALSVTTLAPPPASQILTLTLSAARSVISQSNVVIENLRFENVNGIAINIIGSTNVTIRNCFINRATEEAISIENSSNITIENCLIYGVTTGVYALNSQTIKVNNNQFVNVRQRYVNGQLAGRGQFVQFNVVTGTGNTIDNNKGENFAGESDPEDLISLYKCVGTSASYISVRNNMFRGGGPSNSGSGIVAGDNGGRYMVVENNTLLDPGQAGIAVASGRNINILNNKIYARQQPWTNNPLYVWNQSTATCSNITVTGNRVNWTDRNGAINNGWNAGNCSTTVFQTPTTITLAEMNVPAHLITFVTEAELLMIRGSNVQNKKEKGSIAFNRTDRDPLSNQFLNLDQRSIP